VNAAESEDEAAHESEEEEEDSAPTPVRGATNDGEMNSQLAVGYKHDRSFVIRGSKIGVFRHDEYNQLEHMATINSAKKKGGILFSPNKVASVSSGSFIIGLTSDIYRLCCMKKTLL
jgi:hypothetical protein